VTHRKPFWQVQAVFDPDGGGGDFSYTMGLAGRGVPELHLWARPSLGDDPGEDWKLSMRDTCHLLNELAWDLLQRRVRVGDSFDRTFDDGLVTARFQLDAPQESGTLEAYGAGDSPVIPVRWSLERPPVGPSAPMSPEDEALATTRWLELTKEVDFSREAPGGCRLPRRLDWSPDQRYGPRTPLVLALMAHLWQADATDLGGLVHVAAYVDGAGALTYPTSVSRSAARPVGRHRALAAIHSDVHALADELGKRWLRKAFMQMQRDVLGAELSPHQRRHAADSLRHLLADSLTAAASAEAMADVLPLPTRLAGLGPFLGGLVGPGEPPGPEWVASPAVLGAVRQVVLGLTPAEMVEIAHGHREARDDPGYQEVYAWLSARAVTGAASAPLAAELVDPAWQSTAAISLHLRGLAGMWQEWLTALTASLVHRLELSEARLETWVAPFRQDLPDLRGMLDRPVG